MDPLPQPADSSRDRNREWIPTPIDWSVEFPRSPQHLSNQLRGKRFNTDKPQLELFDNTYRSLPEDVRKEVERHNIDVVGFDLSISQQRAYEAGLYLLTATGAKSQRIVFTPDDWLRAYGVEKRPRNTRDKEEMSSYERDEAFAALVSLGMLPWLIQYSSFTNGKWHEITRVAPMWQCATQTTAEHPLPRSARALTPQEIAPLVQTFKNANLIELEYNPIWFDQHDTFYFYKPGNLYIRIGLALEGNIRRHNKHTHAFLDWIFYEVGRIRVEQRQHKSNDVNPAFKWTFSEEMESLALQLRMTAQVSKRNWKRIRENITNNAVLAQQAQIITAYEWRDNRIFITFNEKTFADLDRYLEGVEARKAIRAERQKRQKAAKTGLTDVKWPFDRPVSGYSYSELKEMKLNQVIVRDRIRQKLRTNIGGEIRQPTPEEEASINYHSAVIKMLDDALIPKPPQ